MFLSISKKLEDPTFEITLVYLQNKTDKGMRIYHNRKVQTCLKIMFHMFLLVINATLLNSVQS